MTHSGRRQPQLVRYWDCSNLYVDENLMRCLNSNHGCQQKKTRQNAIKFYSKRKCTRHTHGCCWARLILQHKLLKQKRLAAAAEEEVATPREKEGGRVTPDAGEEGYGAPFGREQHRAKQMGRSINWCWTSSIHFRSIPCRYVKQ